MWDERYSAEEYAYGKLPNDFLKENFSRIPMGRVLCLAEGEGRNAVFLAQHGYEVTGVDSSIEGVKKAQRLAEENNIEAQFVHADLADFEIGDSQWEGIISISCHLPSSLRKKVHSAIVKGLRPGGILILEAYTPAQLQLGTGGPKDTDFCMSSEILHEELSGLTEQLNIETERELLEGIYHTGRGLVVQYIGMK